MGFPDSSVGKESACSAGDSSSIPGLGRSPGEGIGYPLQYSWASLVAQLIKNPPATWKTWVRSLSREDPLEKGMATHSNILPRESHGQRNLEGCSPWDCKESDMTEQLSTHTHWEIKPGSGVPVQCFFIVRMELDIFTHLFPITLFTGLFLFHLGL